MKDNPLIIGIGEVLWDLLPAGKLLGGAPANFTYDARALGAQALVVSRVGSDALGREILAQLSGVGLRIDGISIDPAFPTGTVTVALDANGKPTFTIHENVAWDYLDVGKIILDLAAQADVICFGTLAQRAETSRNAIRAVLAAAPPMALRICDINLRQHFWSKQIIVDSLERSNVLKLNDEELPVVARLLELSGDEASQMRQLADRFNFKAVALTKGANGSALLVGDRFVGRPGSKLVIADTIGAGDSYTAALAMGLLAGLEADKILESAHRLADYVCTRPGAMPAIPLELIEQIKTIDGLGRSPSGH